jgi:hypothetical protein
MKSIIHVAAIACVLLSVKTVAAQDGPRLGRRANPAATLTPPGGAQRAAQVTVPTPETVTPEMWIYSQELNRHDDPAQAVRRKAEIRAAQRMQRIAAMKWFGFSNARPQVSPVPMMSGGYSPAWVGNGSDRYDWVGVGWPQTSVHVEHYDYEIRR